ncbi:MAG: anaerobic ribonucleoside-triphosphate reductase activating protein [Candidatus Nezhaarchaeota archaeon]|nr:anaerobic ribonucleoside-triphosphate reductase activating protein [Candidatus Nezhaarchaeota archaeon]
MENSSKLKIRIGGIIDISTVDWPSKICTVVFFSGCNFRCPYCQNGKLVDFSYGKSLEINEIVRAVLRSKPLIEGVVLSGGECTLQAEGLINLCKELRKSDLSIGIDTNGSMPHVLEELLERRLVDRVAIDVKAPLEPKIYGEVIGLPGQGDVVVRNVERTLELLLKSGIEVEVRFLAVPTMTCSTDYVREVAKKTRGATRFVIQQFRPEADLLDPSLKRLRPPTRQELLTLAFTAMEEGASEVYIRTREHGLEKFRR